MRSRIHRQYRLFIVFVIMVVGSSLTGLIVPEYSILQAHAYEVWLTEQSDTGDKSGGTLYIYDGRQLLANPSAATPLMKIDFAGNIDAFCRKATKKGVRRPHMIFFTKDKSHAVISFLTGHVLIMDAATKKPEACLLIGKNVHAAWPTPDQQLIIAANIKEKTFVRISTDYSAHQFSFDPGRR